MEIFSANKKYNIERHYEANHKANYDKKYPKYSESRTLYIAELKSKLLQQRKLLKISLTETQCVTLASFHISMKIAKYRKPFSEGEFIKDCFLDTAKVLFSEFKNKDSIISKIQDLQLSHQTIQRRIISLASDISVQTKGRLQNCLFYSLALDETTDRSDTSQLCIW